MASISSIGIGSGTLTSDLIDKIVGADRAPTELRLDRAQEELEAELSAYGQIQNALSDFRLETRVLSKPALFGQMSVDSTSSVVSGSANSDASPGSYTLEVSQLAQAHSLSSNSFTAASDVVGTGTLTITAGTTSANITIDASNSSIQGIADAINAEADLNVNASVIDTGNGFKLVLSASEAGEDNAISIDVSGDGDGDSADDAGLSQLVFNDTTTNLTESVVATNAEFKVNGVDIVRDSNTVSDVVAGLTLELSGTNDGSPAIVSITQDTDKVADTVEKFVESYNALQTLHNELTEFDPDGRDSGVLLGDQALRTIFTSLRSDMYQLVAGLESEEIRSLSDIGINTNSETGALTFDRTDFTSALSDYPDDVEALFAAQGRTSDSQISFEGYLSDSKAGEYAINLTQIATKGSLSGAAVLSDPPATITIGDDNDTLSLTVDGVATGTITLTQSATYTADTLAAEIQSQINADSNLINGGVGVTVSYDAGVLSIISDSYGSDSSVEITAIEIAAASTDLGLTVATGTDGVNVEGTINGQAATGVGQRLTVDEDGDASGLSILVKGGAIGDRGTVTMIRGIGDAIVSRINEFMGFEGSLIVRQAGVEESLNELDEERAAMENRLTILQNRLAIQFTSADILIGKLNSTGDFLTNFFKSLQPRDS